MKNQSLRSIIIHLRFPFSFFLLPIFLFAWYVYNPEWATIIPLFIILHLIIYPSSNGYNSLMDRDTESIGGIEKPTPVPSSMSWISLMLDCLGMLASFWFYQWTVGLLLFIYVLASRAYSYRGIRLKKYAILGYLTVVIFQGALVFVLSSMAFSEALIFDQKLFFGAFISALMIGASYPLTQIYQHQQDADDGVKTISIKLGIKGTFVFSMILFLLFNMASLYFFAILINQWQLFFLMVILTSPSAYFLINWARNVWKNENVADYKHAMKMSKIGSVCMNLFYIILLIQDYLTISL